MTETDVLAEHFPMPEFGKAIRFTCAAPGCGFGAIADGPGYRRAFAEHQAAMLADTDKTPTPVRLTDKMDGQMVVLAADGIKPFHTRFGPRDALRCDVLVVRDGWATEYPGQYLMYSRVVKAARDLTSARRTYLFGRFTQVDDRNRRARYTLVPLDTDEYVEALAAAARTGWPTAATMINGTTTLADEEGTD